MIIRIRRQSAPWKCVFMLSAVLVWGSSLAAGEAIPTNTVVARYSINPDALTEVVSSVGLVGALRASLMCDAAMPLDEELGVLMSGQIKDPVNGGPYPFLDSGLGFLVKSRDSIHGNLASVVRASHGDHSGFEDADWEEESAWNTLIEIVETGLTKSLAANGKFLQDSEGHVPLRVAGIRTVSLDELQTLEGGLEHIYLLLSPNTTIPVSNDGGLESAGRIRLRRRVFAYRAGARRTTRIAVSRDLGGCAGSTRRGL